MEPRKRAATSQAEGPPPAKAVNASDAAQIAPAEQGAAQEAGLGEIETLLKFTTLAEAPYYSRPDSDDEDEDEEDDEDATEAQKAAAAKEKEEDPKVTVPTNGWVVSQATLDLVEKYAIEAAKRNQDRFSLHIHNNWTGYGFQEDIENQFHEFNNIMKEKEPDAVR